MATVTPRVMAHSSEETCMRTASGRRKTAEVSAAALCGPRHRLPNAGQRDDDTVAKEYSPRRPVCQITGSRRKPVRTCALVAPSRWLGWLTCRAGERQRDQHVGGGHQQTGPVHPLQRRFWLCGKVNDEEDGADDAAEEDEGLHAQVAQEGRHGGSPIGTGAGRGKHIVSNLAHACRASLGCERQCSPRRHEVTVTLDLLTPSIELG